MKNTSIYLLWLLLFFANPYLYAQQLTIDWQACFGGSDEDVVSDMIEIESGYLLAGSTNSFDGDVTGNPGATSGWVVMIDKTGNMLWERSYGGSKGDGFFNIIHSDENLFFLTGVTNSSDGDINNNPYPNTRSWWFVKIDSIGNLLWEKVYGGNAADQLFDAAPTADGGLVAIGWSNSADGDVSDNFGYYDWWIVKLDRDGALEWEKSIGGGLADFGQSIIQTSDGGYLAGGALSEAEFEGNITCDIYGKADAALVKLDADGNIVWQQCYGGSENESAVALLETEDGFLFSGYTGSDDGDLTGNYGDSDAWVVKVDSSGNLIWQRRYGGTKSDDPGKILRMENGGYVVSGVTKSNDIDVSGNHSGIAHYSIWIIHLDSSGYLTSQQVIGGGGKDGLMYGMIKKSDYHYVIGGHSTYGPSWDVSCELNFIDNWMDFWVFEARDTTMVSLAEKTEKRDGIIIYPNPATTEVWLQLPENTTLAQAQIELYSFSGRLLHKAKPSSHFYKIDVAHLPKGLYLVRLWDGERWFVEKLVVR